MNCIDITGHVPFLNAMKGILFEKCICSNVITLQITNHKLMDSKYMLRKQLRFEVYFRREIIVKIRSMKSLVERNRKNTNSLIRLNVPFL